ncbi:putative phosphinothricin acetyltransferase YwnH [Hyella patelloides LEGE 07179]|uniref:Putative phosphinothricin acetyltransferase YwnH n=1 Tax=Hyella patelloides LEGE 07179 TaxID=945734 RepID=A0A563VPJ8_9CYAN|nr:GNAT family N-acetyltransferase [Hyella patelloides]VEP13207.1 putative phosphinothricin acetyltransferase YwnH [Hyella patelloides LEGE 07179]
MYIRDAQITDLTAIVQIYNSTISDRMATADTTPVTVESRLPWLQNRDFRYRPVWVMETTEKETVGWLSFNHFYGRPAYHHTAEISIYVAENYRRCGIGSQFLEKAIADCPQLEIKILLGFIFAHNQPSLILFKNYGFQSWGLLPQVAELDNQEKDLEILGLKIK